jgi:hypothetical protein
MPYIAKDKRPRIDALIPFVADHISNVGELNYAITKLIHTTIERQGVSYDQLNAVIGALECAKLELYRVVAAPYEGSKKTAHGSVSSLD